MMPAYKEYLLRFQHVSGSGFLGRAIDYKSGILNATKSSSPCCEPGESSSGRKLEPSLRVREPTWELQNVPQKKSALYFMVMYIHCIVYTIR